MLDERAELVRRLDEDVRSNREWLMKSVGYPLA